MRAGGAAVPKAGRSANSSKFSLDYWFLRTCGLRWAQWKYFTLDYVEALIKERNKRKDKRSAEIDKRVNQATLHKVDSRIRYTVELDRLDD